MTRQFTAGVFCEGYPGLQLANLPLITQPIGAIDWHAPLETEQIPGALAALDRVLLERDLKLDAVVFGLAGERYDSPEIAKSDVGFAAPGAQRRAERFQYATALLQAVATAIPAERFVRGQVTLKGHFGAFEESQPVEYVNLCSCLRQLAARLHIHSALLLAETGCEPADAIIRLIKSISSTCLGCNWDTANLALWGAEFDNFAYAAALADAGLLRGVHIKGGQRPPAGSADTWGTEVTPSRDLVTRALNVLQNAACFDGPVIVERELFLGGQRESQVDKAAGLNATLSLIAELSA